MIEALVVVTPPGDVPVTLDGVKQHLRVTHNFEDGLITNYRDAALDYCERILRRKLITQTVELRIDRFPRRYESYYYGTGEFRNKRPFYKYERTPEVLSRDRAIFLPGGNVTAVESIKYFDPEGVEQTLTGPTSTPTPGSDYQEELTDDEHAYVFPGITAPPNSTTEWPSSELKRLNAVTIRFDVGYGTTQASVPATIRQAILIASHHLYNREAIPKGVDDMLEPHRVPIF